MKLRAQNPPHIRARESNMTLINDVMVAMLFPYAMATFFYGVRALALGAFGVCVCVVTGAVCTILSRRIPNIRDHSNIVTGMMIPLMLPATVPFNIVLVACVFAIAVVKYPFGGMGQNVFNPAASGVAFAMICWPRACFTYPAPFESIGLEVGEAVRNADSLAHTLKMGGVPTISLWDVASGIYAGPMGGTMILLLLACLLYLTVRRAASLPMSLSFLAGAALVAAVAPQAPMAPGLSVIYELSSGLAMFGAVFLVNDPVTSPKRNLPKAVYGFVTGVACMVFRRIGSFEESLLFALLMMNATVWLIDLWGEQLAHYLRGRERRAEANPKV